MRYLTSDEALNITSLDKIVDYWVRWPENNRVPRVIAQITVRGSLTWKRGRLIYFRGVVNHNDFGKIEHELKNCAQDALLFMYMIQHTVDWYELTSGLSFYKIADYHNEKRVEDAFPWFPHRKLTSIRNLFNHLRQERRLMEENKQKAAKLQADVEKAAAFKKLLVKEDNDMSWRYDDGRL